MDINAIFKFAVDYGLFPVLFVFAFWYIISESKEREKAQRQLYEKLSEDVQKISNAATALEEAMKRTDSNVSASTQSINNVSQEVAHLKYMINTLETIIRSYIQ